jgi:hypothetical protein
VPAIQLLLIGAIGCSGVGVRRLAARCRPVGVAFLVSLFGVLTVGSGPHIARSAAAGAPEPAPSGRLATMRPDAPAAGAATPAATSTAPSTTPRSSTPRTSTAPRAAAATQRPTATTAVVQCPLPRSGFDCDFQRRFAAAQSYVARRPGTVGIVVRDRTTGATWRNEHAGKLVWTASTVKLAMTVDLLLRDRAASIALTAEDRTLIRAMLHSSDDKAADTLWSRYGGADYATRFPDYGLTSITFVPGFPRYWGFMRCTTDDLDRLMSYVLGRLPADLRDYVVGQMRTVAANQQWGVWGAGPAARPGNKNGWSAEETGWVMNSVGFVGSGERYTLALMNDLRGAGGYDAGMLTDSEVARLIFSGRF